MGIHQIACFLPIVVFVLCAVAGAHAYKRRKEEVSAVVSPRKLLYLTYAFVLMACSIGNFMLANVVFVLRKSTFAINQLEILSLTITLSYLAAHVGVVGVGRGIGKP